MKLLIYGAGGLGREVLEMARIINERSHRWDDFLFVVDDDYMTDGNATQIINGVAVCSYGKARKIASDKLEITIAVGEPAVRENLFTKIKSDGLKAATLIHPDVHIPETTKIGEGVTICGGCFISCNMTIQDNVYIQPHTGIGHDCVLGEGCVISGNCSINGAVCIGRYTYIGTMCCIKEQVHVGAYTILGMASVVYRDIQEQVIAMGNPARVMKRNEEKQVFKQH